MDVTNPGLVNVADKVEGNPTLNGGTAQWKPRKMNELVSVAQQAYPPTPNSTVPSFGPAARDVIVTAAPRPPRAQATYRPRASEVAIDPRAPRSADVDFQVVGSAGSIPGRLERGPGPVSASSPRCEEIHVVPLPDPAAPGLYSGSKICQDQRPTETAPNFCIVGLAKTGTDVYLVPLPSSAVLGLYQGPDKIVEKRVEILPPTRDVKIADQVIGSNANSRGEKTL